MTTQRTPKQWEDLDKKLKNINFTTAEQADLEDYVALKQHDYEEYQLTDQTLWICCKTEDFEGFSVGIWDKVRTRTKGAFRRHLLKRGVYVHPATPIYSLSQALYSAINGLDTMHEWTDAQIEEATKEIPIHEFTSGALQFRLLHLEKARAPLKTEPPMETTPNRNISGSGFGYGTQEKKDDFSRQLSYLRSAYTEDEKYDGESGGFDFKLQIFFTNAKKCAVPQEAYDMAFSTMLKGKALQYYHMQGISRLNFQEACDEMRIHLEGAEFQRKTQSEWNLLSLQSVINSSANSSKTVLECFKILTDKMDILRQSLPPPLRSDSIYANKIVEACHGVEACRIGTTICNPMGSLAPVLNLIKSSIMSFEAEYPRSTPSAFNTAFAFGRPSTPAKQGTNWISSPPETPPLEEAFYTDRTYHRGGRGFRRDPRGIGGPSHRYRQSQGQGQSQGQYPRRRKCYVCQKENCISYNHTDEEIQKAKDGYRRRFNINGIKGNNYKQRFRQYVMECEGHDIEEEIEDEEDEDIISAFEAIAVESKSKALVPYDDSGSDCYFTSLGSMTNEQAKSVANELANRAFLHAIGQKSTTDVANDQSELDDVANDQSDAIPISPAGRGKSKVEIETSQDPFSYTANTRYTGDFVGIMIDTGASTKSTAGIGQFDALQKLDSKVALDVSTKGQVKIQFGIGMAPSIGSTDIDTPIGQVRFHVVQADTPFLLCLADMDRLRVHYNNLSNMMISDSKDHPKEIPVVRRFGHPFLLWNTALQHYLCQPIQHYLCQPIALQHHPCQPIECFLTDTELRRLHRRFGHPSANRLRTLLQKAGHQDVEDQAIEYLTKYCHQCQMHGASPGRFRFTLRDKDEDIRFNYNIIVDIMYISGKPLLHVVDEATRYNSGRWLKDISAQHTWDALKACWMDTYLGPPDWITTDAGKNFVSRDFKYHASQLGIKVKAVPIEAHNSIGMVERYHGPIRRAFQIIATELPHLDVDMQLQMAFKAINDSVGPKGLVPTLLVFGAYPRMVDSDSQAPSPTVAQRANAIRKAMEAIQKLRAERQVMEALKMRNGPNTEAIHSLPPNSEVLVWREGNTGQSGHWDGPFNMISMEGEDCIIDMGRGSPLRFRSTVVKPYHQDHQDHQDENSENSENDVDPTNGRRHDVGRTNDIDASDGDIPNGRPHDVDPANGNTGLPEPQAEPPEEPHMRSRGRPRKQLLPEAPIELPKRKRGRPRKYPLLTATTDITTYITKPTFEASRQKEINGLLERGVFKIVSKIPPGVRLFNSRFVDDIKHQGTPKAYEKSRLVVQAYNDKEKEIVLTQSPTIQRVSQRLILCLAAMLPYSLYLRDISQAYVQSTTKLNRPFYVRPPEELSNILGINSQNAVLKVVKPLYGVPEAGNHWFKTYHTHHINQLNMEQSTYDPCLLYTKDTNFDSAFGIVGLQTDDTLLLANEHFATREQEELEKAGFIAKDREILSPSTPIRFNGGLITQDQDGITLTQKKQCEKLSTVQGTGPMKEQYIAQRARGAYIASMCQPEASFDLSFAAQITNPGEQDIKFLNKRLQWQLENQERGLRFVKLDISNLQLLVFTDASFANNKDLSSQIGYVIVLADSKKANILHWSSIKCKRVTRSVLASELYAMAHGYDISVAIKSTLDLILQHHRIGNGGTDVGIPLVLCTDSKSLYDCIVRLGTTQEKRLMIDVMGLRQAYERKQISEVKWIAGGSNPADAMTKSKACDALEKLITTNSIDIQAIGWVERTGNTTGLEGGK